VSEVPNGGDFPEATVGIVVRTKDRPRLLARALDSILSQTHPDWQAIVVNDAGDPEPVEALIAARAEVAAGRLRVLHRQTSTGMEAASNAGLAEVSGRYLAIHDDDDSWHPDFLARTVALLEQQPELGGVVTGCVQRREVLEGDSITVVEDTTLPLTAESVTLAAVADHNRFPPIALLARRDLLDDVGGFDERLPVLGDWEANLRLLRRAPLGFLDEPLAVWHIREGQGSTASSVTARSDLHDRIQAVIRDRLLRDAMAENPLALALATNTRPLLASVRDATGHAVHLLETAQAQGGRQEDLIREAIAAIRLVEDLTRESIRQSAVNHDILKDLQAHFGLVEQRLDVLQDSVNKSRPVARAWAWVRSRIRRG